MIGASRETVTPLFTDFKKKQLLQIKGSTLVIRDRPRKNSRKLNPRTHIFQATSRILRGISLRLALGIESGKLSEGFRLACRQKKGGSA